MVYDIIIFSIIYKYNRLREHAPNQIEIAFTLVFSMRKTLTRLFSPMKFNNGCGRKAVQYMIVRELFFPLHLLCKYYT